MSPEKYQEMMAEMGISRGGLGVDAEIESTPSGSQMGHNKQPTLLNPKASTVPERRPMEEVDEKFKCNDSITKTARAWWDRMTPEERKKASQQRAANGRKSWARKKAAVTGEPAVQKPSTQAAQAG